MPILTSRNSSSHITTDAVIKAVERAKSHFLAAGRDEAMFLMAGILFALDVEDFNIDVDGGIWNSPTVRATVTLNKGDPEITITVG